MKITKLLSVTFLSFVAMMSHAGDLYKVGWSHYTGWEPWGYASDSGIVKKWADKYGIEIEVTLVNDYIESINLYTAGQFDAVTATNMDALTIPAVGGIDSTALIIGDYSNGSDGIVAKNANSIKDLAGREIRLVELSVSHYMLAQALDMNGMKERDIKVINQSDADIASVYLSDSNGAAVTWNPMLQQVRNSKGTKLLFDSSKIPGEIIDIMFVKTDADERFKKALTGAWYETMGIMNSRNKASTEAIAAMADIAGGTEGEFKAQLKTTAMFYDAKDAADFTASQKLVDTMDKVRNFSFEKGLFGTDASSPNFVGIAFPNKKVLGNKENIKLRFDDTYMKMASENKL
jgi:NitT/TauT family transport system substrate-binding protein